MLLPVEQTTLAAGAWSTGETTGAGGGQTQVLGTNELGKLGCLWASESLEPDQVGQGDVWPDLVEQDEMGWDAHAPSSWLDGVSPQVRERLHNLPQGWARFSTCFQFTAGGCGQINIANDGQLVRQVVVKKLCPELMSDTAIRRFVNEAQITAQLEHPGIVPVYELGVDDHGLPFYAMKQVRGETLAERLARVRRGAGGRLTRRQLTELLPAVLQVCQTMAFAHQQGVMHRDLKPDNIILGHFGETTVVDWGLARRFRVRLDPAEVKVCPVDLHGRGSSEPREDVRSNHGSVGSRKPELTAQGAVMGTASYMSPEQATGENDCLDQRTDVFALGVILCEILSGHSLFGGESTAATLANVRRCERNRIERRLQGQPLALAAICRRALATEPAGRYPSAAELGADVQNYLLGLPVSGHAESSFERFDRWAGTHRELFRSLFGATLLLLAVVSIGMSVIWGANLAEREARREAWETAAQAEHGLEHLRAENARLRQALASQVTNTADRPEGRPAALSSLVVAHH